MAHQGATTAVGDGGERHAYVPLVDIVAGEGLPIPGQHLFMLVVERIEGRLEEPHEAGDAPDILGRAAPLAGDEGRVVDVGLPVSDLLDDDVVAPVVAEVVDVEEPFDAPIDEGSQADPRRRCRLLRSKSSSSGRGSL